MPLESKQLSLGSKIIFTGTTYILCILLIFFQGDYASVDAMQKKVAAENNSDQILYAELGAGGGRKGPKSKPMESNYAQVKVDRSRRRSLPPHYGGLDDDDGVIV